MNTQSNFPDVFWGKSGAGILFICQEDETLLLVKRSALVEQPGTWGVPGGSCKGEGFFSDEDGESVSENQAWQCAVKEVVEELGHFPKRYDIVDQVVFKQKGFTYTTFVVNLDRATKDELNQRYELNWENDEIKWRKIDMVKATERDLHFGVQYALKARA